MIIEHRSHTNGGHFVTSKPRSLPQKGKDPYIRFAIIDSGSEIGIVDLVKTRWGFWETHSYLYSKYRGKGNGIFIYDYVISFAKQNGWQIRSSLDYSSAAERVWRSKRLRTKHKILKKGKRFIVKV